MKQSFTLLMLFFIVTGTNAQTKKVTQKIRTTATRSASASTNYLKRGDFVIQFNNTLDGLRASLDSLKQDTSLINTYDRNRSYVTSVSEIKDLKAGSSFYEATKSLIEKWGIAAMFKKDRRLNASGSMTEAEVYDILHVTMSYNNPAVSRRAVAIKRDAFDAMLTDAANQVRQRIANLPARVPDVVKDTMYIVKPFEK